MKKEGNIENFYYYSFPTQAILVTCNDQNDKTNAITIAWHTPVSKNPPLYVISIAPKRYSLGLINESEEFVINFLSFEHAEKIHYCGTRTGRNIEKISNSGLTIEKSESIKTKRIKEAFSHLECKLFDKITIGDHILVVGEVKKVIINKDAFENEVLKNNEIKPAYYLGNNIYTTINDKIKKL